MSGSHTGDGFTWSVESADITIVDPDTLETTFLAAQAGSYYITLTSSNNICTASDSVLVQLTSPLRAPNVFTPDGDGFNDRFEIFGIEDYSNALVTIYNRWGGKVYQSANYYGNEWDGGNYPDGVYYYVIELNSNGKNDNSENHTGCLHLIR